MTAPERQLASFSPQDQTLSCQQINDEFQDLEAEARKHTGDIKGDRVNNQVAGFIGGALFPPAYLLTEGNYESKEALDQLQVRWDELAMLSRVRAC